LKILNFFNVHLKWVQPACTVLLLGCIEPPPNSSFDEDSPEIVADTDENNDMGIPDAAPTPRDEPDFEGRDDMWEPVEPGPDYPYPDGREPDLGPTSTEPAAESDMDENGR
jgi:hypothetical protein